MASAQTTERSIVQHAEFSPPLSPTTRIDLSVLQQYVDSLTVLHLGPMTHAAFVAADVPMLLVRTMPQLAELKLVLVPSSAGSGTMLPQILIRPERLPALHSLHIEGATLRCESLSQLKRLELRNTVFAPLGHTFDEFLTMLATGEALEELVLENYIGRMGAGDSTPFHFPLATCKTAYVKDTTQNLYRLLAHLSEPPEDTRLAVSFAAGIPSALDILPLKGAVPPLQQPVQCATFQFVSDGAQLICAGWKHKITIEHCSGTPVTVLGNASSSVHSVALVVLMRFLAFMPVSTLEIADATEGINLQEWFDLLVLTPNVRELFIKQPIEGPGRVVSNIVTALASFSGQAVESPVKCPHLKDVKVRGTVYSPWLIDVIGQSAKWRAQYRAPLRSLELVLAPRFNGMPHCEFASDAARDWAAKLQVDKYVGRVVVKDAIIRSF